MGHDRFALPLLCRDSSESLTLGEEFVFDGQTGDWFGVKKVIIICIVDNSTGRMVDDDVVRGKEGATKKYRRAQMRRNYSTKSLQRPTTVEVNTV